MFFLFSDAVLCKDHSLESAQLPNNPVDPGALCRVVGFMLTTRPSPAAVMRVVIIHLVMWGPMLIVAISCVHFFMRLISNQ
jgi:hypothetical protein